MTDPKHTPGPWTASEGYPSSVWHVDMPGRTFSITVSIDDDEERDVPDEETEANARLMAAAPELLAALKRLASAASTPSSPHKAGHGMDQSATHEGLSNCEALVVARAAIDKATEGTD